MLAIEKPLPGPSDDLVLGFDLEWTKNYRVRSGNKPFCFSFVYFAPSVDLADVEALEFGVVSRYVECEIESPHLIQAADRILGDLMQKKLVVVGHQCSSDMTVLIGNTSGLRPDHFVRLRQAWRNRRHAQPDSALAVFDTRYDLDSFLAGKSRRLVDVCTECNLDVTQPEIKSSMTGMQRDFYRTQDSGIRQRLTVVNIRHSLSAALLYCYFRRGYKPAKTVNVNKIIYNNLQNHLDYVREQQFEALFS
jgi:hypothetical protein